MKNWVVVLLMVCMLGVCSVASFADDKNAEGVIFKENNMTLHIGWASCSITPEQPVFVSGQFCARISQGVLDPVTSTVLALESDDRDSGVVMVSCDLVCIPNNFRDAVRRYATRLLPQLKPESIIINATHTHTAPEIRTEKDSPFASTGSMQGFGTGAGNVSALRDLEKNVMAPADYVEWAASRIAEAIAQAWNSRKPGGIGYGMGHAVVGHNRRISYYNEETRMYGKTDDAEFSHVEGYEDHSVNILCTWDAEHRLTGLVLNIACPSQVSEHMYLLSADYWHETRQELRRRLGEDIYILAQASAAGDQSPHLLLLKAAEERMWKLTGRTQREDIAVRIADAVTGALPYIEKEIDWQPVLKHSVETIGLPRRNLTEQDVADASQEATRLRKEYEKILADLEAHPQQHQPLEWYQWLTHNYRMMKWNEAVAERYALQQKEPTIPVELHALRIGDVAVATNPFEYYLDFGMQIKARSRAVQTFVVQLAGAGTYLPTQRAIAGRSYGAMAASTPVGPEGGRKLAEWSVGAVNAFFPQMD